MPRFLYKGFSHGELIEGSLRAANALAAEQKLQHRQITVDSIDPVRRGSRFGEAELIAFTKSMASLLKAGVSLSEAGSLWMGDLRRPERWSPTFAAVREGVPLSEALNRHRDCPRYLTAMIQIGEATGSLPTSFAKAAHYLEERRRLRQTLVSALIYPAIILVVAAVAMAILFIYVLPIFEEMYKKFDAELPAMTLGLMNFVNGTRRYGLWVLLLAVALILLGVRYFRRGPARLRFDAMLYKIPLLGSFLASIHQVLFCQSIGHLLGSGVGLLEALEIVSQIPPNASFRAQITGARARVARGVSLAESLESQEALPKKQTKMIGLAEQSGDLSETLLDLGAMLKESVDQKIKNFAAMFEPLLIVGMAIVIGFVLVALYLPMFDIVQVME